LATRTLAAEGPGLLVSCQRRCKFWLGNLRPATPLQAPPLVQARWARLLGAETREAALLEIRDEMEKARSAQADLVAEVYSCLALIIIIIIIIITRISTAAAAMRLKATVAQVGAAQAAAFRRLPLALPA
jgi:hypothetical protein